MRFGLKWFEKGLNVRSSSGQVGPSTCQTVSESSIGRLWLGDGYG